MRIYLSQEENEAPAKETILSTLCTCVDSMGQSSGIEVTFRERSFSALESSRQLTITLSILEDMENVFNLSVIPIAKYPPDAEGMIMCVVLWTSK